MSDEPTTQEATSSPDPASSRQLRWLASGVWALVFVGLLVTSYAGIVGPMSNIDLSLITLEQFQAFDNDDESRPNNELISAAALIITAAIGLLLLWMWAIFGRATTALLSNLSDPPVEAEPATASWLSPSHDRSSPGDLLMLAGMTWALLVSRPVVIAVLRLLTS